MPNITVTFHVTNDELECLRMGKCDKPSADRVKQMLLREARSNVRNMFSRIDDARVAKFKKLASNASQMDTKGRDRSYRATIISMAKRPSDTTMPTLLQIADKYHKPLGMVQDDYKRALKTNGAE